MPPGDELEFAVQSSRSGEIYQLKASHTETGVRFKCSCPAGENGQYCRHRLDLLAGVISELKSGSPADVETLAAWACGTKLEQSIAAMTALQEDQERIKRQISAVKKEIARRLIEGN